MNRRYLVALSLLVAAGFSGCSGAEVAEAPPVFLTNPQEHRVEALAMTSPRANAAAIRLRDGRVLICGGTATGEVGGVLSSAKPRIFSFFSLGAGVTPAQGSVKPTVGFTFNKVIFL
jgi:hypothetical protein